MQAILARAREAFGLVLVLRIGLVQAEKLALVAMARESRWQDKQDNDSPKARSHESHSAATQKSLSLLEINSSQRDAALCSAALAQSGSDVMVSLIP